MINQTRLKNNTPPYFYIGSKTYCTLKDGFIYDKNNKKYFSSTRSVILKEHLKKDIFEFEILLIKSNEDKTPIVFYEREEQLKIIKSDWDSLYYNKSYAVSGFTTFGFANYHYGDGKIISLPTNHQDVKLGKAIAQQKNRLVSIEEKEKLKKRIHPSKNINWSQYLQGFKKKKKQGYYKPKSEMHKANIAKSKEKRIEKLDLALKHICYYKSIKEASEACNIKRASISACCVGRTKTAHGYIFKYC